MLNRDLSKVIVLDDLEANMATHHDNWLRVPSFKVCFGNRPIFCCEFSHSFSNHKFQGDVNDRSLLSLLPFLQALVSTNPSDVRPILKRYQVNTKPRQSEIIFDVHFYFLGPRMSKTLAKRTNGSASSSRLSVAPQPPPRQRNRRHPCSRPRKAAGCGKD